MDSSRFLVVFLGLSFTGITAAVAYMLMRKDEESDHEPGIRTSRRTVIKVKVPSELMGTLIGRGGSNIRNIQEKTGARINCGDEGTQEYRIVTIQGTPEAAQLAESIIHETILNQPLVLSHEMWVPATACGRIIGKGGESIRSITRTSCARVLVDSAGNDEHMAERRILIKGTAEQIALAQSLIDEQVAEDADFRRRVEISVANRSPRREPKDTLNYLMGPANVEDEQSVPRRNERFNSNVSEGFFDVFVSALENPGQFWVQLISTKGVELDQLVDKMTEYYTDPVNRELHVLQEINVGQIVAAPFDHDNKWYRAEVLKIEEDEYDAADSRITLYYGDYGDYCVVRRKDLYDLRTDFLTLYFQAIECILAHVKPNGETWSDEATNLFEELAEVAMWRKKMAHVVTYRDGAHKKGQRAGSPVPVIELHDMEKGVNIGEELVKQGFAVWESSSPSQDTEKSAENSNANRQAPSVKTPENSVLQRNQNTTNRAEEIDPAKMAPSAVFGPGSGTSHVKDSQGASSSFISNEKGQTKAGKFRPRTLGPSKSQEKTKKVVETIILPESYSTDEDEDGFTLG